LKYAVLLDFGSTYTKVVCVDLVRRETVLTRAFPSTVHTDAGIALAQCFKAVEEVIGKDDFDQALKYSTSSAAGGLRIAVSGLTESLSIEAGRNASFGAGGKIVYTASGFLSTEDIDNIKESDAEILLMCGGYEGGNRRHIMHNVKTVSESDLNIPIIYAGNSSVTREVRLMFSRLDKECFVAENIIPNVGKLNIEPTVNIIRDLFMNRITNMNGVGVVKKSLNGPIVPTPAAVLAAGELLYKGTKNEPGIGPYMMVDIGGATTDIYSFAENVSYEGAKQIGSPEPVAKRTVEGDMGMRESSICLMKEVGRDKLAARCELSEEQIEKAIQKRITDRDYVADTDLERIMDHEIACSAVSVSARRHAGSVSKEFYDGYRLVQRGKNLMDIKTVIGTGGILVKGDRHDALTVLQNVEISDKEKGALLLPVEAKPMIDEDYVFFAAGLLKEYDEEAALSIMKKSIRAK